MSSTVVDGRAGRAEAPNRAPVPRERHTTARRTARLQAVFAVAAACLLASLPFTAAPAGAAPGEPGATPSATPSPSPSPTNFITAPADGSFIPRNSVTVEGTALEDAAAITVTLDAASCSTTAAEDPDASGTYRWSCVLTGIPNGAGQTIVATETSGDASTRDSRISVDVLGPPSIDPATPTTGVVSGSGYAGASVTVTLADSDARCTTTVNIGNYWSCNPVRPGGALPASGSHFASASQLHSDIGAPGDRSQSASRSIVIDNVRPGQAQLRSPAGDYRIISLPVTFSGISGEPSGSVTVYVDGVPSCTAGITLGNWACSVRSGISHGAHQIVTIQQDEAGNHGDPSAAIRVFFGPPPVVPPAETDTEATPEATPESSASPSSSPQGSSQGSGLPTSPHGNGTAQPFDAAQALTNWGTPTGFGATLPSLEESIDRGNWLRAPLLALAAIILIALPLRLLANSLRGRIRWPFGQITGRNRGHVPPEEAHEHGANPWLAGFVPLAATAAFIVASSGFSPEVRYLRLAFAVGLGLAIINIAGVAFAARLGSIWQRVDGRLRFMPVMLAAAAITGLLSRGTGLTPPIVTGVLIGVVFAFETPVAKRATVNLLQMGSLLVLGITAWIGHSVMGAVAGFWPSLTSETLAAVCLTGIGSALVLMLPFGSLPGRVIMERSFWLWLGVSVVGATIGFAILLGGAGSRFPLASTTIIAIVFAATCLCVWLWLRFFGRSVSSPA